METRPAFQSVGSEPVTWPGSGKLIKKCYFPLRQLTSGFCSLALDFEGEVAKHVTPGHLPSCLTLGIPRSISHHYRCSLVATLVYNYIHPTSVDSASPPSPCYPGVLPFALTLSILYLCVFCVGSEEGVSSGFALGI